MNGASILAFSLIFAGSMGLLFVVFVVASNKLRKNYFVHYENLNGVHGYVEVKACSKKRAALKVYDASLVEVWITKVVRQRGE